MPLQHRSCIKDEIDLNPNDLELNLILAGPILRLAEPKRVCVWIATSKQVEVILRIYLINRSSEIPTIVEPPLGQGKCTSKQLGQNLYVALPIAVPIRRENDGPQEDRFPTKMILAYDLELIEKGDGSTQQSSNHYKLNDLNILEKLTYTITYERFAGTDITVPLQSRSASTTTVSLPLPTFVLQDNKMSLNLLHGSCRALHGVGSDALAFGDDVVASTVIDPDKRPTALFLSGDQIYADDVAAPLITHLSRLGTKLLGWEQTLRQVGRPSRIPIFGRNEYVHRHVGFTSGEAENHLLSLGEYFAMYLVAWNEENWPCRYRRHPLDQEHQQKYDEQEERLDRTRISLWKVRRLLANIPTYMMFDDHDVTDDWNLDRKWVTRVSKSDCGSQVIANALIAYAVFQAWGNEPNKYEEMIDKISDGLQVLAEHSRTTMVTGFTSELERFITEKGRHQWAFYAPTYPGALFLDTRTRRNYVNEGAAELIDEEALKSLLQLLPRGQHGHNKPLIVVSATPVFGLEFVEKTGQPLISVILDNNYLFDLESWAANGRGFLNLMDTLANILRIRACIFLSGDVHYAFTQKATFSFIPTQPGGALRILDIVQLNSSAFKNITPFAQIFGPVYDKRTPILIRSILTGPQSIPFAAVSEYLFSIDNRTNTLIRSILTGHSSIPTIVLLRYLFKDKDIDSARVYWGRGIDIEVFRHLIRNIKETMSGGYAIFKKGSNQYDSDKLDPIRKSKTPPTCLETRKLVEPQNRPYELIITATNIGLVKISYDESNMGQKSLNVEQDILTLNEKEKKKTVYRTSVAFPTVKYEKIVDLVKQLTGKDISR
jgi:hypothetical protein